MVTILSLREVFGMALTALLSLLLSSATYCAPYPVAKKPVVPHDKITIISPLTHSDWSLHNPAPEWGPAGVRHMLDMCKEAGMSKVLWRAFDSGRAMYESKLADPAGGKSEEDNMYHPMNAKDAALLGLSPEQCAVIMQKCEALDYAHFDSLGEAVRYGHSIGLDIYAWITINEDDHGWGWSSRFSLANRDSLWKKRDGTPYHSQQSFAYKKVRDYKLGIVKELVNNYDIDGIFLDWLRTGDIRDNPQTDADGVANYGYEDIQVQGFKRQYGIDPHDIPNGDERWVKYRAQWTTEYMRSVRKFMKKAKPELPLTVMLAHQWSYRGTDGPIDGNLRGMLLDPATWAKECLIDAAIPAGYYRNGGTPAQAYKALKDELGGKVDIWYYGWVQGNAASFEDGFWDAKKLGATTILFWEADYIDNPGREEARAAMSGRAFWPSPRK